jgi:hypothetical protein
MGSVKIGIPENILFFSKKDKIIVKISILDFMQNSRPPF